MTSARAQPADSKQQGDLAAMEAETKFKSGDYAGAVEKFKLAYQLDADPGYLFNVAQAYRLAKDCASSADYYRQFLEKVPSPPNLDQVKGWLADQEACVRALASSAAAEADAKLTSGRYVDAVEQFKVAYQLDPNPDYLFKIAEAYRLAHDCSNAAESYRRFLTKAPNPPNVDQIERRIVEQDECAKLPGSSASSGSKRPTDPKGPRDPVDRGAGKRRLAMIATGAGVVALGVAGFFTWDARYLAKQRDNLLRSCDTATPCTPEQWTGYKDRYNDRGDRAATIAITGYAIGGVAIAGGVALFLMARSGHEQPVAITPTSGGAMVLGGFAF
ncbi:MAG: hypothetical protein H0T42_01345 [Deltaproteobacteria bacterium]|nr:hypothetical protein [Deltaproteobacteria bacterium]